jgi:carboxyl-terminal processing protease
MTLLSLLFPLALSATPVAPPERVEPAEPEAAALQTDDVTVEELRRFALVFREVQRSYVEPVSERQLMEAAIRGLLTGLDPHSAYLDQDELGSLNEDATGAYGGLGLEVQVRDGVLRVVAAIDDTPAALGGLKSGDVIVGIDGTPLEGDVMSRAVDRLRGTPGTEITLTVMREAADPFDVTLKREIIKVSSVRSRWLSERIGYVRISTFQSDTATALTRAVQKLQKPIPLDGLVLDLRSNPGGLLQAAVGVVDAFVERGQIVSTRGRQPVAAMQFSAEPGDLLNGAPLVVLIDGGSASASEIVAGALQDHRRGLIVGQRSFGKGSVQSVLPLANGDGVKLTTARYYTPSDRSIQAQGIVPDVELPDVEFKRSESGPRLTSEADLAGHLGGGTATTERKSAAAQPTVEGPGDDYALTEASHIIRALVAQRKQP